MTKRRFRNKLLLSFSGIALICAITVLLIYASIWISLPNVSELSREIHYQEPLRIYSEEGQLMSQYGEKWRIPIEINQVPPLLVQALLATEDQRFFEHHGIDLYGLMRAAINLITTGKKSQGASTITMQVARNFYLSREKTYARKIKEIMLAIKIDRMLSKQKILELYLNKIFFGHRAYGIQAAALRYFNHPINELSLAEIAILVGIPQSPAYNNPLSHPDRAKKRRNHVLHRMLEEHMISNKDYQVAINTPIDAHYHDTPIALKAPYASEAIRQMLLERYGPQIYQVGAHITSSINQRIQTQTEQHLWDGILQFSHRHGWHQGKNLYDLYQNDMHQWLLTLKKTPLLHHMRPAVVTEVHPNGSLSLWDTNQNPIEISRKNARWILLHRTKELQNARHIQDIIRFGDMVYTYPSPQGDQIMYYPNIQGAVIVLDAHTGNIKSLIGGTDFHASHFNRATQAKRQTGSAFKPFIYAQALQDGYQLSSLIDDAPLSLEHGGAADSQIWRPENHNHRFYGPSRLRDGLVFSRNLMTIRLLQLVGTGQLLHMLANMGLHINPHNVNLAYALGSYEMTPMELLKSYTIFTNQGVVLPIHFIKDVNLKKHLPEHLKPLNKNTEIIRPTVAYLVTTLLQDVIQRGTGKRIKHLVSASSAGKTGTTNSQHDAWFIGYNPDYMVVVWLGYDQQASLHEYASKTALPIWAHIMHDLEANSKSTPFSVPHGIITAYINPKTGKLSETKRIKEYFEDHNLPKPDNEPQKQKTKELTESIF